MPSFFTFGHSTHSLKEIKKILDYYLLDYLVDVRRFPVSGRSLWLSKESLEEYFGKKYVYLGKYLGGYRKGGYEKHMETEEFKSGIKELLNLEGRVGIMCSEKLWFRCHRRYIADYLAKMGHVVIHIIDFREYIHPSFPLTPIPKNFFERDAEIVARELLGKILVRKIGKTILAGRIVETEAYYGKGDPASRAKHGKKEYNKAMWLPGGHIFVYMVHANWMLNITTDGDEAQAVLIRSLEPLVGIKRMKMHRGVENIRELCRGPGKLSRAMAITSDMNSKPLEEKTGLWITHAEFSGSIERSGRIGVKEDMEVPMRFFVKDSPFVSKIFYRKLS